MQHCHDLTSFDGGTLKWPLCCNDFRVLDDTKLLQQKNGCFSFFLCVCIDM